MSFNLNLGINYKVVDLLVENAKVLKTYNMLEKIPLGKISGWYYKSLILLQKTFFVFNLTRGFNLIQYRFGK